MFARVSARTLVPLSAAVGAAALYVNNAECSGEDHVEAAKLDWPHKGPLSSFDYASIRRGFQVYRQICASCHSVEFISFRNLVGVTHTEQEIKEIAASYDVQDGPDATGEMFTRPGRLYDRIPGPYRNEAEARSANNGAYPPDLSLMAKARGAGVDYIFSLLTGYIEAPAGKAMLPGLHYNPYFPGGAIAMSKQLEDGQLEYDDGTPATVSQMAKDVSMFLAWTAEPEHDERKRMGFQWVTALVIGAILAGYAKRTYWATLKSRKITFVKTPVSKPKF